MWTTIIGHERQIEQLRRALAQKQLPNAYLFSGLRGVGKYLVAKTFAAALMCSQEEGPCGQCIACRKLKQDQHADFFPILPEGESIKIDQMRELAARLQFHPLEGRAKFVIIDEAHRLTESAANSMLKILEEPPSATHFVLVTHTADRLPATIRSRCQSIVFSPLAKDVIASFLINHDGLDPKDAQRIAQIAEGSLGLARSIEPAFIDQVLGKLHVLRQKGNAADIIAAGEEWSRAEEKTPLILDLMAGSYRDLIVAAEISGGKESGQRTKLFEALSAITTTRRALETTANKQLLFEQLLFTLAS